MVCANSELRDGLDRQVCICSFHEGNQALQHTGQEREKKRKKEEKTVTYSNNSKREIEAIKTRVTLHTGHQKSKARPITSIFETQQKLTSQYQVCSIALCPTITTVDRMIDRFHIRYSAEQYALLPTLTQLILLQLILLFDSLVAAQTTDCCNPGSGLKVKKTPLRWNTLMISHANIRV